MSNRLVRLILIAAAVGAITGCGSKLTPTGVTGAEALEKSGLLGRWAIDCASDYRRENPHLVYAVRAGGAATEQLLMNDPKLDRVTPLQTITLYEHGFIEWTQKIPGGSVTVTTKVEGRRQKSWSSRLADGTVLVSDGHYSGGQETPWFNKCGGE